MMSIELEVKTVQLFIACLQVTDPTGLYSKALQDQLKKAVDEYTKKASAPAQQIVEVKKS